LTLEHSVVFEKGGLLLLLNEIILLCKCKQILIPGLAKSMW